MEVLAPPIFLLTDFGDRDHYVGHVKAVIAGIAPRAPVVDISHGIEPFAIDEAAWMLEITLPVLPESAVLVAVVDPGVGTSRRALAACRDGRYFVGPDNGVLTPVLRGLRGRHEGECDVREITAPQFQRATVSSTFHGRDIFAPVAAHLAAGLDFRRVGSPASEPVLLPPCEGEPHGFGRLRGHIVHIDRYGNLVTTIRASQLFPQFVIEACGCEIDVRVRTFAEAPRGAPFCHAGSSGFIVIAVNEGSAAELLGASRGDPVLVRAR
ncbi:MAG: SAM-dependent chlorinase/fluorinase [Dehalococcoidia bacterium]|nr:SAM-dependent chlorinase/fluorinase [Dehalococcoidia bacterium]NUQ56506.1 SAM-dependent chlorinase/fluorinase [Dehalococcoidia bacterium]